MVRITVPPIDPSKIYLSIAEVGRELARDGKPLNPATVWRWIAEGRGPAKTKLRSLKIGGRRVVARADLDAFLAALNPTADTTPVRTPAARERAARNAKAELAKLGV